MHRICDGVGTVTGIHVPATGSGVIAGVVRCRSAWVCPICASQITETRRRELADALATWRDRFDGRVVMCTYTFQHHALMPLRGMIERLNTAFRAMKQGGAYGRLLKRYGIAGSVAAREVKHSQINGWHPHIHELLFAAKDADVGALECELRHAWEVAAAAVGLTMNQHGFKLDDCDQRIADYVAKWGHEPAWTEAEEISKGYVKVRGTTQRDPEGHYTPFQLLRFAHEGDTDAAALFVEYAHATYRRAQIRWKKGFRQFLGLVEEKTDDQAIEEHEELGQVMVCLNASTEWPIIVGNDAVGELVAVLAMGDMQALCAFLEGFGIYRDPAVAPWRSS